MSAYVRNLEREFERCDNSLQQINVAIGDTLQAQKKCSDLQHLLLNVKLEFLIKKREEIEDRREEVLDAIAEEERFIQEQEELEEEEEYDW